MRAKFLIASGADVQPRTNIIGGEGRAAAREGGFTALLFASRVGDLESARALVEAGSDINQTVAEGTSALVLAIRNGHYELGLFLLEKGADPNIADSKGRAALFAAVEMRNLGLSELPAPQGDKLDLLMLIRSLPAHSADVNARLTADIPYRGASNYSTAWLNMTGATPYLRAAASGDITVMRFLLGQGADPHLMTSGNATALMLAAGVGWAPGQSFDGRLRKSGIPCGCVSNWAVMCMRWIETDTLRFTAPRRGALITWYSFLRIRAPGWT